VSGWRVVVANPRPYLLAAAYAACFGVEITIANIVSLYLFNQFHLSLTAAGLLGACVWRARVQS
jgi:NNP family nitrate/nitrite transporter-like MFS transporter